MGTDCKLLFPLLINLDVGRPSGDVTPLRAELPIEKPKKALTEPVISMRATKIKVRTAVEFVVITVRPCLIAISSLNEKFFFGWRKILKTMLC
jgi:hypothetical protein